VPAKSFRQTLCRKIKLGGRTRTTKLPVGTDDSGAREAKDRLSWWKTVCGCNGEKKVTKNIRRVLDQVGEVSKRAHHSSARKKESVASEEDLGGQFENTKIGKSARGGSFSATTPLNKSGKRGAYNKGWNYQRLSWRSTFRGNKLPPGHVLRTKG